MTRYIRVIGNRRVAVVYNVRSTAERNAAKRVGGGYTTTREMPARRRELVDKGYAILEVEASRLLDSADPFAEGIDVSVCAQCGGRFSEVICAEFPNLCAEHAEVAAKLAHPEQWPVEAHEVGCTCPHCDPAPTTYSLVYVRDAGWVAPAERIAGDAFLTREDAERRAAVLALRDRKYDRLEVVDPAGAAVAVVLRCRRCGGSGVAPHPAAPDSLETCTACNGARIDQRPGDAYCVFCGYGDRCKDVHGAGNGNTWRPGFPVALACADCGAALENVEVCYSQRPGEARRPVCVDCLDALICADSEAAVEAGEQRYAASLLGDEATFRATSPSERVDAIERDRVAGVISDRGAALATAFAPLFEGTGRPGDPLRPAGEDAAGPTLRLTVRATSRPVPHRPLDPLEFYRNGPRVAVVAAPDDEGGDDEDDDPQCVCGAYRSEHRMLGCADGFQTPESWARTREAIRERVFAEDDDSPYSSAFDPWGFND